MLKHKYVLLVITFVVASLDEIVLLPRGSSMECSERAQSGVAVDRWTVCLVDIHVPRLRDPDVYIYIYIYLFIYSHTDMYIYMYMYTLMSGGPLY